MADAGARAVQDRLNARPGKALGYLTPAEAFLRSGAGVQKRQRPLEFSYPYGGIYLVRLCLRPTR